MTLASQLSAALSGLLLAELYQSRGTLFGQVSRGGVCAAAEWTDWPHGLWNWQQSRASPATRDTHVF